MGCAGGQIDFALLLDGLAAEREQGITIDVAYRYFSTEQRKFIVADTPGHTQYTRNMITGASTADLAVILVDACHGVRPQTRRHSFLVSLIGIKHVVLAVNKMDLVDFSEDVFERIRQEYCAFANKIGLESIVAIPMSARDGDNIITTSVRAPWYSGPTLMDHLNRVEFEESSQAKPFRMCVQWVNRPDQSFRGFSGMVSSGVVRPGDAIRVLPGNRKTRVRRIVTHDGDLDEAVAGRSVTLTIDDEIDISRGDVLANVDASQDVTYQFEATVVWMADERLLPGRSYWLKIGTRLISATITAIDHAIDVNTLEQVACKALGLNEIGVCTVKLGQTDRARPICRKPRQPAASS